MDWALFRSFTRRIVLLTRASCLILVVHVGVLAQNNIEYYASRTVDLPAESVSVFVPHLTDTIAWDTVYQVRAASGMPVSYFRKIQAPVCFDNKCRMLNIIVHWNITGRYLGFELPTGEYLSKEEHEPFVFAEYERMHGILNDPFSPLAEIAYNELVPAKVAPSAEIDAVSSATSRDLLEFVVEGAAFTTFKLWHIVNGPTREEVSRLTTNELSPASWLLIAESPDVFDRLWALDRRALVGGSNDEIREVLLSSIIDSQYNVANSAIAAVTREDLESVDFQVALVNVLNDIRYALKKSVISKLGEAAQLQREPISALVAKLSELSADQVGTVLKLLSEKQIEDDLIYERVGKLLEYSNNFISRQAYDYLRNLGTEDPAILKQLRAYEVRHGL